MSSLPPDLKQLLDVAWVGSNMAAIFYGAYLVIALYNIYYLSIRKGYRLLLLYTTFMLVVTTIYIAVAINSAQTQLIDAPQNPGLLGIAPQVVVDAAFVINTWLADTYLMYRCYVIYMGNPLVLLFPAILFLGSMGTSIAFLWSSAHPGAAYGDRSVQIFGIPYWTLSLSLNIIVTCLIAFRLFRYRRNIRDAMGKHHGRHYTTIVAISVESAALYAVFALVALVCFAVNSVAENVTFPMLGQIQVIAPNLIIYRVANGKSFTSENSREITNTHMEFGTMSNVHTTHQPRASQLQTQQSSSMKSDISDTAAASPATLNSSTAKFYSSFRQTRSTLVNGVNGNGTGTGVSAISDSSREKDVLPDLKIGIVERGRESPV